MTAPLHGTAGIAAGKVVYTPDPTYAGLDSFSYDVQDGRGGQSVATIVITLHNRAPHAAADSATTAGGSVTLDVRDNDGDADGDPLSVSAPGGTAPSQGVVSVNTDGTLTYTAAAGHVGTDTFSYVLDDGRGGTDTALVTVTIPNTAPHASDDTSSTTVGIPVTVPVLANDSDPNIPVVPSQQLSVSGLAQPANGRGLVTTDGTTVTFTPAASFTHGATTFGYTVSDGAGGSDSATVTISIDNSDPVAAPDAINTTCVTAVDIDVLANDSDPNDDTLTVIAVAGASHGTATITGTGSNTRIHYLPEAAWTGADVLDYTLSDGTSTVMGHVTVTTGSCAPVADPFSQTVDGGTTTSIDVLAHSIDPDSGALTVTTSTSTHGTAVDPAGAVVYTPDGRLRRARHVHLHRHRPRRQHRHRHRHPHRAQPGTRRDTTTRPPCWSTTRSTSRSWATTPTRTATRSP